jgi:hypothetical protein
MVRRQRARQETPIWSGSDAIARRSPVGSNPALWVHTHRTFFIPCLLAGRDQPLVGVLARQPGRADLGGDSVGVVGDPLGRHPQRVGAGFEHRERAARIAVLGLARPSRS